MKTLIRLGLNFNLCFLQPSSNFLIDFVSTVDDTIDKNVDYNSERVKIFV